MAALAGAALALFGIVLANGCGAYFWPRLASSVTMLAAVAGGLAGLGVEVGPAALAERVRRRAPWLLGAGWLAGAAALLVLRLAAPAVPPGPGLGLLSLPWPLLLLAALPFAGTLGVLAAWVRAGEKSRPGWLLAGAGAGVLAASLAAGTDFPLRTPWFGGRLLEFTEVGGGASSLGIDRRLRQDMIAPHGTSSLAFWPEVQGRRVEVLLVGFPSGPLLATLLENPRARVTVLEEDASLVEAVLRRWPALETARGEGRVVFRSGSPRWALERSAGRYDLIALSAGWSPAAYLSRALNLRADHRWTVEAFRSYLARLREDGYLLVQRNGMGRVVTTLREAVALPAAEFSLQVVIFGDRGRLASELWYHPRWLRDGIEATTIERFAERIGTEVLYRPTKYRNRTIYRPLIQKEGVKGMYFSTPLDLSPPTDARPFFDHAGRLMISPVGRSLPEELEPMENGPAQRAIPSGDLGAWVVLAAAGLAMLLLLAGRQRRDQRRGVARGTPGALSAALWIGFCWGAALTAFAAWARWLAPSAAFAQASLGCALLGGGAGWHAARGRGASAAPLPGLAAVLVLFAAAGYRAAPAVPAAGATFSALFVGGAGLTLGLLLGRALAVAAREIIAHSPPQGRWPGGAAACSAALTWIGAQLASTHFGYPLVWALAAVGALAALRALRLARTAGSPT